MVTDSPRTVLVVEDHEDTRAVYRAFLERAGWVVREAETGDEALELARRLVPTVAIVDISIPGLDGWETMRRLRSEEATRSVTIVAVTGHPLDEDRERALEAGCAAYLVKPVPPRELVEEVERLAGGP